MNVKRCVQKRAYQGYQGSMSGLASFKWFWKQCTVTGEICKTNKKNYETYYRSARVQVWTISKYFLSISNNFLGLSLSILVYLVSRSILDYLGLSLSILVYLGLSRTILDYLGLSRSILVYLGPSWSISVYLGLSGTIWDYLGLFGTIWDYLALSGTIWYYLVLSDTIWDYMGLGCK